MDLFLALQHPYIYPVLDLEFVEDAARDRAYNILVLPFNSKGSLKDLIYKVSLSKLEWLSFFISSTVEAPRNTYIPHQFGFRVVKFYRVWR